MLAAACSGAVFRDDAGTFTAYRRRLALGYPEEVRLRLLAQAAGRMAQCGQYNYSRMRSRGDLATAQLYLAEFCRNAMLAWHLLRRKYAPYEKWLLRSTAELEGGAWLAEEIRQLLLPSAETSGSAHITAICSRMGKEIAAMTSKEPSEYLGDMARELAAEAQALETHRATVERLARLEFETFDTVQKHRRTCCLPRRLGDVFHYAPQPISAVAGRTAGGMARCIRNGKASGRNLIMESTPV